MKLRIRGNSLRLRLTRTEVEDFGRDGEVADRVELGGGTALTYRLLRDGAADAADVDYEHGRITVRLPAPAAKSWAQTDQVSLSSERPLEGENALRILVEKDFACLKPREGEDESDMFPHPETSC